MTRPSLARTLEVGRLTSGRRNQIPDYLAIMRIREKFGKYVRILFTYLFQLPTRRALPFRID